MVNDEGLSIRAKNIAINFIKYYVLRGDSMESLMACSGGQFCSEYNVEIGGYIWDKAIKNLIYKGKRDEIIVSQIDGKDCLFIFKLKKLYDEIRSKQISLF